MLKHLFAFSRARAPHRARSVFLALALAFLGTSVSAARPLRSPPKDMLGTIVAISADAYIAFDELSNTWEIGNSAIRRRMQFDPRMGFRVTSLTNVRTGTEWLARGNDVNSGLLLVLDGKRLRGSDGSFAYRDFNTLAHANGSLELVVALTRGDLTAHLHYVLYPWTSVIEQWAAVENTGAQILCNLTALDSISIALRPSADPLTLSWVQGLSPQIRDPVKKQPLPVLRLNSIRLSDGVAQTLGATTRATEDSMGWFALSAPNLREGPALSSSAALTVNSGEGLFGGIEWSGAWQLRASRERGQTILRAGMLNLRHDLAPGEIFVAPRRFLGFFTGDLDDAAHAAHTFARTYRMRPKPRDFPWTQSNTWYAYGIDLNEEQIMREVDAAAELGLELFYVDAGWYEGSPQSGDFGWGLGTWRENREKFPTGLAALSDYAHSRGMQFGLWVEPERVDLRYVGREFPRAWLSPDAPEIVDAEGDIAPTAQICLGHRAAREWMQERLARLIVEYRLDWLKWDYNIIASCNPPGQSGDGDYYHITGEQLMTRGIQFRYDASRPSVLLFIQPAPTGAVP